ncbi:MAG: MFS transporter [Conexivisphaerales archaeon]
MVQYKWVALSNTTLGTLMGSTNGTIILISLPTIFNGIGVNPLSNGSFQYLLWILFGYNIAVSTLLVTFGRLSDMYGRVRLYNLGFAIFSAGSILLFITPSNGNAGALELIVFRFIQGVGAAFLLANSAAILTDAFPPQERGKALGLNQVTFLAGSLIGLVLGGLLAPIDWRLIFLVSVPFGVFGTIWSYTKLRELGSLQKGQKIDLLGNITFAVGLTLLLIGLTYGLIPYGKSLMGWSNPEVVGFIASGLLLLALFPFVESRVEQPMFRLQLFRIRMFSAANIAGMLSSIAYGGVMLMLIILLQGIWLPLHGYSYESTPFWSGIYIIPMMLGFVLMGPTSGILSDRMGSKLLATAGMVIVGASFIALSALSYNFDYRVFALIIFVMGVGNGLFGSPNIAAIMNAIPPEYRGVASGMRATLQNVGQTLSIALFFGVIISALASQLPSTFASALTNAGAPQLANVFANIPPTSALFAAFLGYNPVASILQQLPQQLVSSIPQSTVGFLEGKTWFPSTVAPAFMSSLRIAFYTASALAFIAAVASALRGAPIIYEVQRQPAKGQMGIGANSEKDPERMDDKGNDTRDRQPSE